MANFFDQFDTAQSKSTVNPFDQFDQEPQQPKQQANPFDQFDEKAAPTESGGFFGSFWTSLKERANTALPAAKLYTGLGDQEEATKELAKYKDESEQAYKQTEFGEIGDAAKSGNYGEALGKTVDKFREVAGSSFGSMAPAIAAGVGASAAVTTGVIAAPFALTAAAVGTAAFGLATLGSYIADNIAVQKEKQTKEGRESEDINRLSATVAAAGSTALDIFGFKFFKPLGALIGLEGKEAAQRTTAEIIEHATRPGAYAKSVASGTAKGIAFEVPQEVTQQVLERWQADKPLDPFTDSEAAREYLEAAGGALLLGGPMGGVSGALGTRSARDEGVRREAEKEISKLDLPPAPPREAAAVLSGEVDPDRVAQLITIFESQNVPYAAEAALDRATVEAKEEQEYALAQREAQGAADVTQPNAQPSGISPDVVVQPGAEPAPGGVGGTQPSGMVSAGADVGNVAVREGSAPAALTPGAPAFIAQPQNKLEADIAALIQPDVAQAQQQAAQAQQQAAQVQQQPQPQAAPEVIQEPIQEPIQAQPQPTLEQQIAEEDARAADFEAKKAKAESIAKASAANAFEQVGEYANLDEAIDSYRQNLYDTLDETRTERGENPAERDALSDIADRAFNSEVEKLKTPVAPTVTTEAPAKPKRGRPTTKTAEEVAANQSAAKRAYNERQKAGKTKVAGTDAAIQALDTALKPIDESKIETDAELTNAETDQRVATTQAIKALLLLQDQLKSTDTAHGKVTAALSKISKKQIADVRTGIAYEKSQVSRSEKTKAASKAEAGFSKATNGAQALSQVIKTGNAFQKFLARRIRGFVSGVKFIVIEKGDVLPEQLQRYKGDWEAARGLFIEDQAAKTRTVYVRGASFGADQGVNNITVLHELLHAATNQKLSLGLLAAVNRFDGDAMLTRATKAFGRVMLNASDAYEAMDKAGIVPDDLRALVESTLDVDADGKPYFKIFELHQEFLAYGMTEPVMQEFLMTVDATQARGSAFNRFVHAIMDFFGIGENEFSAMTDLVLITDKILGASKTSTMRKLERIEQGEDYQTVLASAKQTTQKTNAEVAKLEKSNFADAIREKGLISKLIGLRNQDKFVDGLVEGAKIMKTEAMQQLLPALQTSTLVQWATKLGIKGLDSALSGINKMASMRNKATNAMIEVADKLNALASKDAKQYKALGNVMHYSTIVSRDPNTVTTDKSLTEMWARLTPESKKLYNEVREFYADSHKSYHALLDEQIAASDMQDTAKGKLIASIKKMYEEGEKLYPYFPLMRYGQYWARVGKGKASEFQMFESQSDRDRFVRERVKQLNTASGNTRTQEEIIEGGDIDVGNDLTNARKQNVAASEMLKDIFNSIDEGTKKGEAVDAEKLKDEIYQMYLQSLPDRNFRRQFMHRQGIAGFSGDIHRNFVTTGTNMANQLARIKYGPEIVRDIERAGDSLKGNPNKAKLGEFVSEMRLRADEQVRPTPESGLGFAASNILNTSAFLWMMTSIKTIVAQLTAVPVFVGPVLASHHGVAKTAAALTKTLNVFNGVGVTKTNADGSSNYTMPSMANLKGLTADEKLATQYMLDNGISDNTMAYDLGGRRNVPTALGQGTTRRVMKATASAMTALFHHGERMIREVTFMTSYRLNRDKGMEHEAALEAATAESHEALGNYHASNRPRGLGANRQREVLLSASSPVGRSVLQFKMFPAFVTTYFVRNAYNMFKGLTPQERKQARIQFLGTLGMSYALAGYVGIPGISMAMGIVSGLLNALKGEDDDDPLEKRNLELWVRNIWLPQTFGNVKVGGRTMDELLDKGLIAGLTGYDITSSLSMNNMWFPEMKEQATATAAMSDYLISLGGPGSTLITKQMPKAIDYFKQGEVMRGLEQMAPAIVRAPLTAARYAKEGATTTSGAAIKEAEEFTIGELLAQSAGFATEGLQARREAIFQVQGEILKAKRERSAVLLRLDKELIDGSDSGVTTAIDKLISYNSKNWWDPIDGDHITQSMRKRLERKFVSDRGFPIDQKYYVQVMDLLEPSSKKIEREVKR